MRFKTENAGWEQYENMTLTDLNPDAVKDVNELEDGIVNVIITGAETCIPKSTGSTGRVPVPW